MVQPAQGEIWIADLDLTRGREQAGKRPVLVVSADAFNHSPADLLVVLPITSKEKGIRSHIPLEPKTTGLRMKSYVICEQPRTVAKDRLTRRAGAVSAATLDEVRLWLRVLLDL